MFRESMRGLEKIFHTEPPEGIVVMIVGKPGTMKSSITHQIISSYLWKHSGEKGVYITFEEPKESHLRNMRSLSISYPEKQYVIEDFASFRHEIRPNENSTFEEEEYIQIVINELSKQIGLNGDSNAKKVPVIGFDSLNSFEALFMLDHKKLRFKMQEFFMSLRKEGIIALMIMEGDADSLMQEYFMADGVIEVGIDRSVPHLPKRYIMVHKMRGTDHDMAPHMINLTKNGLEVGEPVIGWKGS
jgi:KaiC/GvpD/RAD55 family RecA-like ATPase